MQSKKPLKLNFSTCPNDTFMFCAMVNRLVETKGYQFEPYLADIEELNRLTAQQLPDITKLSYGAFPELSASYQLLDSGSALGSGVGPLVVSRRKIYPDEAAYTRAALPGEHTTAHLLFNLAYPNAMNKKFYLFSEIEQAVLDNEADVGVLIHESRFTYMTKGLTKVADLGEFWEKRTNLPVPLGGIAIRKDLPENLKTDIAIILQSSIKFAFANRSATMPYVRRFAQEMDEEVMEKHINLYVNNFSLSLGNSGRTAVLELLKTSGKLPDNCETKSLFIY